MHGMKCFYGAPRTLGVVSISATQWASLIFVVLFSIVLSTAWGQGLGFVSIDCGAGALTNRTSANITWVSDGTYIATGTDASISNIPNVSMPYDTLRYFPGNQSKNCYSLSGIANRSYLVRAGFLYGNYDRKNSQPSFELLFDATHWTTVQISDMNTIVTHEVIVAPTREEFSVCLARTNMSTADPFISSLEIRLLSADQNLYNYVHENILLKLNSRINFGQKDNNSVRYPDDPYDRIWASDLTVIDNISQYKVISTSIDVSTLTTFNKPPLIVMQTARTGNDSSNMTYSFVANLGTGQYYSALYFAEIQNTTAKRIFNVYMGGDLAELNFNLASLYGNFTTVETDSMLYVRGQSYTLNLQPTANSTLGPILNAAESYLMQKGDLSTNEQDVNALADIKKDFNLGVWVGDPCLPLSYKWSWISCSNSTPPRVIALSLSNMGLRSTIPSSIGNLTDLTVLDLSNNLLYGDIPSFLVNLTKLQELDLQNNNLSGVLPSGFGTGIVMSVSGNEFLCIPSENSTCGHKPAAPVGNDHGRKIGLVTAGILIFVACVVGLAMYRCKRQKRRKGLMENSEHWPPVPPFTEISGSADPSIGFLNEEKNDVRNYSLSEMGTITNNFEKKLGGGSFGILFHGMLPDGRVVVVKKLQSKLQQSPSIFLNKVGFLTSVHHKNLLRLSGFCAEFKEQMLIYEFMPKGSLYELLQDRGCLDWRTRLNILQQAAQGLEHLHSVCSSRIIHGDVKSKNVLLSDTMLAKVSDFGLHEFSPDVGFVVDTTSGYCDPEYCKVKKLTQQSDVYSFGVLMLEVVSGRVPFDTSLPKEQWSIVDWAKNTVHEGNCELVADSSMNGNYNINALSKVIQIALQIVAANQKERPTMVEVVMELKEANKIELGHHVAFAEPAAVDSWSADERFLPSPS